MDREIGVRNPVGRRDRHWSTRLDCRSVLVLVPHMVAGTRLMDVLPLFEADHRVQVVFTVPEPWETWQTTHDFVRALGGAVVPWAHARQGEFDLVLAASTRGIDDVMGPVLLMPHGGGLAQYRPWRPPSPDREWRPVLGVDSDQLVREGKVRAQAIVLTHNRELEVLRRACPRAVPAAVVAGDIAFDRLTASLPLREQYRRALGVTGERVLVVSSTWSERSAFGRHPNLLDRVVTELAGTGHQVVALLHPQIWSHHGAWQVRTWLADSLRAGLMLIPPHEGWRAALVAADHVIGDYGSVTTYAAGIGRPVMWAVPAESPLLPGTPAAALAENVPTWRPDRPLAPQLEEQAEQHQSHTYAAVQELLTSRPGQAGAILRRTCYRLLGLSEPTRAIPVSPVPLPLAMLSPR